MTAPGCPYASARSSFRCGGTGTSGLPAWSFVHGPAARGSVSVLEARAPDGSAGSASLGARRRDRVRAAVRPDRMAGRSALRAEKTEAIVCLPARRHPSGLRTPTRVMVHVRHAGTRRRIVVRLAWYAVGIVGHDLDRRTPIHWWSGATNPCHTSSLNRPVPNFAGTEIDLSPLQR